ncbi:MAG: 30S ribosomal protein S4 [Candidatus Kaiserbacteria bacterium]|nr:MAG: 30S ribosomal protein S4 [Candidatus Kaiserbacteria bacterium]
MLPVKSKYKIAKRLGAAVFEQTQSQKFALSEARSVKTKRRPRGASDYGRQLLEKQRVRYTYGLQERQLSNYAKVAYTAPDPSTALHRALEMRADSVVYRAGLAPTRRAARQLVSHGHVLVNGRRITTPSHALRKGDKLTVREGSRRSPLFAVFASEEATGRTPPQWLNFDRGTLEVLVLGEPVYTPGETVLDYATVFEFYSR